MPEFDQINKSEHYNSDPSGVECIEIVQHMNFCLGNAMKYIWRAGKKENEIQDLKKAQWYIQREIQRLEKSNEQQSKRMDCGNPRSYRGYHVRRGQ